MCDLEAIDTPSIFKFVCIVQSVGVFLRMLSTLEDSDRHDSTYPSTPH